MCGRFLCRRPMIDVGPLLTQIRRQSMIDAQHQGFVGAAKNWQKTLEDGWKPNPKSKRPPALRGYVEVLDLRALVVEDLESTQCGRCLVNWDKAVSLRQIKIDENGTYYYGRARAFRRPTPDHWVHGVFVGPPKKNDPVSVIQNSKRKRTIR